MISVGVLKYLIWVCFLCHFYLTVLNLSKYCRSIFWLWLIPCLFMLFHFLFVKMTQGFHLLLPQTNGAASLPLHLCLHQDDSTRLKFQGSLALGREWGVGTGKDGVAGTVACLLATFPKFLPQHPCLTLSPKGSTGVLSEIFSYCHPELPVPWSLWKPLPLAIEIPCVCTYPSRNYSLKPTSLTRATELCSTEPRAGMGPTWGFQHMDLSSILHFQLLPEYPLQQERGWGMDTFLWKLISALSIEALPKPEGWLETHIMIPASWIIEKKNTETQWEESGVITVWVNSRAGTRSGVKFWTQCYANSRLYSCKNSISWRSSKDLGMPGKNGEC